MSRIDRTARTARVFAVVSIAFALAACSDKTTPRVATTVAMISGNNQTLVAGAALTTPLIVSVLDQDGVAMQGVTVTWAISSGEGTLTTTETTTDANGQASIASFAAGADAGDAVITATVSGLTPIQFDLTVEAVLDTSGL